MNFTVKILTCLMLSGTILISCTKDNNGNLSDNRPAIPVTVTNAIDYRPDPTVSTSISGGGAIQIILTIPATTGRSIKEITGVAASTSYTRIQAADTTGLYKAVPQTVNGTSATFVTSLKEYFVKKPVSLSNPAAALNVELGNRFYFLLTLDNGVQVVTTPVRILVVN